MWIIDEKKIKIMDEDSDELLIPDEFADIVDAHNANNDKQREKPNAPPKPDTSIALNELDRPSESGSFLDQDGYTPQLRVASTGMSKVLNQLNKVDRDMEEVNASLSQLMIACHLKQQMQHCASAMTDFSIQLTVKIGWLSSGSCLLTGGLLNRSEYTLQGWTIAFNLRSLKANYAETDERRPVITRQMSLPEMSSNTKFDCELLIDEMLPLPMIVSSRLIRPFLSDTVGFNVVTIQLNETLINIWHLVQKRSTAKYVRRDVFGRLIHSTALSSSGKTAEQRGNEISSAKRSTLQELPEALVYLMCSHDPSETELIDWILPSVSLSPRNNLVKDLTISGDPDSLFDISINRVANVFSVSIISHSQELNVRLETDLAARILAFIKGSKRFLKPSNELNLAKILKKLREVDFSSNESVKYAFKCFSELFTLNSR